MELSQRRRGDEHAGPASIAVGSGALLGILLMDNKITASHVGKRLLVTDRYTGIPRDEIEVLEVSPSGQHVKLKNLAARTTFWREADQYRIAEVLADNRMAWIGRAGDELTAMLKERNLA